MLEKLKHYLSKYFKEIRIIFLNEKTLTEEYSLKINFLKIFIFFISLCVLATLFYFIINYSLSGSYNYSSLSQYKNEAIKLKKKVTLLEDKINLNNKYINTLREIINDKQNINLDTIKYKFAKKDTINTIPAIIENNFKTNYLQTITSPPQTISSAKKSEITNYFNYYAPIKGYATSRFNKNENHFAIDIAAKTGAAIKSIADGIVVFSDWTDTTGNVIIIQHYNSSVSVYKHNAALFKKEGEKVKKGETIASIGNTGEYSTGPHLHFELWLKGVPINPEEVIKFE